MTREAPSGALAIRDPGDQSDSRFTVNAPWVWYLGRWPGGPSPRTPDYAVHAFPKPSGPFKEGFVAPRLHTIICSTRPGRVGARYAGCHAPSGHPGRGAETL